MTRFARAKGSKASNERAPEDSTPWEVMKEQLMQSKKEKEEASKRQEAENQRITNYENFLKEQKVSKRKATWCDFPEEVPKKRLLPLKQSAENNQQEKNFKGQVNGSIEGTTQEKSKKKKNKNKMTIEEPEPSHITEVNESAEATTPQEKIKKKKKNKNKNSSEKLEPSHINEVNGSAEATIPHEKSKKKKKNKLTDTSPMEANQCDVAPPETAALQTEKKQKKKNKKKQKSNSNGNVLILKHKSSPNKGDPQPKQTDNNVKKKTKLVNGKPVRRKEINDKSFQLIINTKEVELVRFDGFPIMKKDAERLTELRKSMIQKGIPKSEVQRTMKLERRRAEKALARLKRDVCYNCRKGGHNLSDCPELKSKIPGVDAAEGICFKCGSTEHRQFECKVQRDNEFRFATCFICREQGHLARQCPDNPKGLYPNGGSCKLCGDITHLRKDCPTTQGQREETSLKLGTLESADNIEDIGQQVKVTNSTDSAKKQPKKIKF